MQKLSERAAVKVVEDFLDFGDEDQSPMASVIADATGCDDAAELLQEVADTESMWCQCEDKGNCFTCRLAAWLAKYGPKGDKQPCTKP